MIMATAEVNPLITGLDKKLTKKPTLALGIGNNGPLLELAILKEYAKKIKPEIIFWVYSEENDLLEVKEEIKSRTF